MEVSLRQDGVQIADGVLRSMERAIEECLRREGLSGSTVSLSIVDDEEMRELNRRYRGIERSTDVLSFPLEEERPNAPTELGDVVVSAPRALLQSVEYGHSLERELAFLAVHGTLHLLSYDHETEVDEREMRRRQEEVLSLLGITR